MLQSPSKRIQRQQRLNTAHENPILDAKQQQHALAIMPVQKRAIQRHQHRRQLSVPDESLLLKSSLKLSADLTMDQSHMMMGGAFGMFTVTENSGQQGYTPIATQSPTYLQFSRTQHQHVRKGSMDSMQTQRRGSLLNPATHMRPLAPASRIEEANTGLIAHDMFEQPTRTNTAPSMMSVSAFDMAPLPHPRYVNLSSLAMGSPETDMDDSFYAHSPLSMSPGFPPHDMQQHLAMYDQLHGVQELTSSPVLPAQAPCHTGRPLLAAPAAVPTETVPIERADSINNTGITMEEIAGFISGPEPSDGKWVCLYEGCAKRFGRKENIKSHVQTHLGDRQFKCQVCKKCFVRQHDLKRHSKIHTGVKPYPCLCGNSFARHDALTRHRQRGMCIGAFEGVVRKEVKRGRPRKKPLPKDDNEVSSGASTSGASSSGASDTSSNDTPPGQEESTSPSPEAESPGGMPEMGSSDEYTPPTSPSYDVETYAAAEKANFDGFADNYVTSNSPEYTTPRKTGGDPSAFNSHGEFGSAVDISMFTDDMMGLTALERDPTILSFGYIKSEMLDATEATFYTDV